MPKNYFEICKTSDFPQTFSTQMNRYRCLALGTLVLHHNMSQLSVHGPDVLSQENISALAPPGEEVSGTGQRSVSSLDFTPQ